MIYRLMFENATFANETNMRPCLLVGCSRHCQFQTRFGRMSPWILSKGYPCPTVFRLSWSSWIASPSMPIFPRSNILILLNLLPEFISRMWPTSMACQDPLYQIMIRSSQVSFGLNFLGYTAPSYE